MEGDAEGSPWASRAEAGAQQLRRFSLSAEQRSRHASPSLLPPLAPLHHESAAAAATPASNYVSMPSVFSPHRDAAAIPSISTLHRDLEHLSLQLAGMSGAGGALSEPRQTSAPGAPRTFPREQRRRSDEPSAAAAPHHGASSDMTRLSEAPPLHRPRLRRSASPLEQPAAVQPLPRITRTTVDPAAEDSGRRSSSTASSSPPPLLETHTSLLVDEPLRAPQSTPAAPTLAPAARQPAPLQLGAASAPDVSKAGAAPPPRTRGELPTTKASPVANGRGKGRDGRITVVVRKRPMAPGEAGTDCVHVEDAHVRIAVTKQRVDLTSYEEKSDYLFDGAFGATATNEDVYAAAVQELLTVSLAGGSASCFAYGQTGSGKTYTMLGTDTEKGLYLQAAADLFQRLGPQQELSISLFEIYCNSLFDLLNSRHPIVLREDANRRVNFCGMTWCTVAGVDELWERVRAGTEQRRSGTTTANEHSSRSHAVLAIRIRDAARPDFAGAVNFVDLAGSERAADTAAHDHLTRLEGAEINKSLLALKECIRALDEKKRHVPFRGCRLTEVLRDSFTGNSKTVMIAAISPSSLNHEHTNNTLRYAFRVKGLSIASVEPSKARNAPRPYQPVPRNRSAANERTSLACPAEVDARGQRRGAPASPRKPRRAQRRRRGRKHSSRSPSDVSLSDGERSLSASDTGVGREGTRLRGTRRSRAVPPRRGSIDSPAAAAARSRGVAEVSPTSAEPPLRPSRGKGAVYGEAPPPQPRAALSSSALSDSLSSSITGADRMPREAAHVLPPVRHAAAHRRTAAGAAAATSSAVDVAQLEQRLRQQIMTQLRTDIGKELEDVLSEKEAVIAALQRENARLRKVLETTRRDEHDDTGTPREAQERHPRPSVLPALPDPPSPSILQEQLSSGPSTTTSAADESPVHMLP
ncbi:Kinesin-13 4 [Novymonas esmeraldas]|uniref:Kinesin-13 4 n=1 Tax=Novymonas esmeraldas TaxID=1808958 RepID=A0AAW0EUH1_9TRYP